MQNLQNITEVIVSFEKRFYEINPQGNLVEILIEFCHLFAPILPSHYSIAISDTEKFIFCVIGEHLRLPIDAGQKIEELWKIRQVITSDDALTQFSSILGFNFHQITTPLHHLDRRTIGTFSLFYGAPFDDFSSKINNFKKELVQAICVGMQTAVICRYFAEKINQFFSADLILFTEFDSVTGNFFSLSEFKFNNNGVISDNFEHDKLTNGHPIYKTVLHTAQTYVSKTIKTPDILNAPFRNEAKQIFIVTPIISKDQIIGTLNISFREKTVIDIRVIDLLEELAGYISISLSHDHLIKSLEHSMKRVTEIEKVLLTLEEKKSRREITTESMLDIREHLLKLVKIMFNLCEQSAYESEEILSSVVDHLQKMMNQIVHFSHANKDFDNSHRGLIDIKSMINGVLLDIEEKILNQNLTNIYLFNRIGDSGIAELDSVEVEHLLSDILFLLFKKYPGQSKIYFDSRTENRQLIINLENFERESSSFLNPKRTADFRKNSELVFRLAKILFNMNHVEFNFDSISDCEFRLEIKFTLVQQPLFIQPEKTLPESSALNGKFHICIVDDDDSLRDLMVDILESRDFKVVCYGDPTSAIEEFKKRKCDLLITDLGLPKISGLELATAVKKINPAVPVIMVTGWGSEIEQIREENPQIDFVLSKPFNLIDLLRIVENSLKLLKP